MATTGAIHVLRRGTGPADAWAPAGSLDVPFPLPWSHTSFTLAGRETSPDVVELYFNVGSKEDAVATTDTLTVSGLVGGTLIPDSIYRVIVDGSGPTVTVSGLERVASGVRNAFGIALHPVTGDLYFEDNNMDGPDPPFELSADELNRIAAADLGGATLDFGFPTNYIEYRTGVEVGSGAVDPIVAFQPVPPPRSRRSGHRVSRCCCWRAWSSGVIASVRLRRRSPGETSGLELG